MDYFGNRAERSTVPTLLSNSEREFYRDVFASIERHDWSRVEELFAQTSDGPLHQVALAEYYLDANSPRIELDRLNAWLAKGTDLPMAAQIARLALKRGAEVMPAMPGEQAFVRLPAMPKRVRPRSIDDGTMPQNVSSGILERITNDDPQGARQLLDGVDSMLSDAARAEWRQRVAWSFYIENDDRSAYELAQRATQGSGPWVAEGWWTAGLAAWRLGDCGGAADAFGRAAGQAENPELSAAAYYWQSRALVRCAMPEQATAPLRGAARLDETLYGMLAAEQLGLKLPEQHSEADFTKADWQRLRHISNVRVAVELAEIGQDAIADEVLRHQASIGDPDLFRPLTRLARDLGL